MKFLRKVACLHVFMSILPIVQGIWIMLQVQGIGLIEGRTKCFKGIIFLTYEEIGKEKSDEKDKFEWHVQGIFCVYKEGKELFFLQR